MYTPATLLEIAAQAEARYKTLLLDHPPGSVHDGRNLAREEMEAALACAAWLEQQGIREIANVGPFVTTRCRRGDRVRVRRGARVYSTHPQTPREGVETQRSQVVTIHAVYQGYVNTLADPRQPEVVQGKVHWAGAGGYWRWTDINNVERIPTGDQACK